MEGMLVFHNWFDYSCSFQDLNIIECGDLWESQLDTIDRCRAHRSHFLVATFISTKGKLAQCWSQVIGAVAGGLFREMLAGVGKIPGFSPHP